ncbi:MAG TPA: hypothetical protein VJ302_00890 [Blastocatellia bacterium]|nr:hypothetical protein [Blastocatellia bacterium]
MILIRATLLSALTACTEIAGCYLTYLWLKEGKSAWVLLLSAASLALGVAGLFSRLRLANALGPILAPSSTNAGCEFCGRSDRSVCRTSR